MMDFGGHESSDEEEERTAGTDKISKEASEYEALTRKHRRWNDAAPQPASNVVPRRVASRGTKNTRKFSVAVVQRGPDGKISAAKNGCRKRGGLPGGGGGASRAVSTKPKTMVSF